jgi:hypothetical protein
MYPRAAQENSDRAQHARIEAVGRIVKIAGAALGLLLYVWAAAVKNVDRVNERKRSRRGV